LEKRAQKAEISWPEQVLEWWYYWVTLKDNQKTIVIDRRSKLKDSTHEHWNILAKFENNQIKKEN